MPAIEKLTVAGVRSTKPGKYNDGGGLRLTVSQAGRKNWFFRFSLDGKQKEIPLGNYPDLSLADARGKASKYRLLIRDGIHPQQYELEERQKREQKAQATPTFRECAKKYIDAKKTGWSNAKHIQQWTNTLKTYAYPIIGDLPVNKVTTDSVIDILNPIWETKTETATRVRQRVEHVLDWATVMKHRKGDNPARWKGNLAHLFPAPSDIKKVKHHPAMPYSEVPKYYISIEKSDTTSKLAIAFIILTAGRVSEIIEAKWDEIDGNTWTVPAERMKNKKEHRVPLSKEALTILKRLKGKCTDKTYIFPSPTIKGQPISSASLTNAFKRDHPDLTIHGFRSSFRDWAEETTNFPRIVSERSLAHVNKDKVEAAYQRKDLLEKRSKIMQAWANYLTKPQQPATVSPIKRKADND